MTRIERVILDQAVLRDRRIRAMEAVERGYLFDSDKWRGHMSVTVFSKEGAQKALDALKRRKLHEVKEFLEAVKAILPSEESYRRTADEETEKQKRRKKALNKEKTREQGKKARRR